MAGRGLRAVLQPVLFLGIAAGLHGILFLVPGGGPDRRDAGTSRGIRVKTYVPRPEGATPPAASRPAPHRAVPEAPSRPAPSSPGSGGVTNRGGGESGNDGGPRGEPGASSGPAVGNGPPRAQSEFGEYLAHLRSDDVQGWAQKSAKASRRGWKGSGAGSSGGWGAGSGTGSGPAKGSGAGPASGGRGGGGGGYLDPRVRMVVIRYPLDERGEPVIAARANIENQFPPVPYPDVKVKQARFTAGWWNVYVELWTTENGDVRRSVVLRPETSGPQERVFVDQVRKEMERWTFDPGAAEIHVDVRFYVE